MHYKLKNQRPKCILCNYLRGYNPHSWPEQDYISAKNYSHAPPYQCNPTIRNRTSDKMLWNLQ
jgi:hypothetical protein